MFFPIPAADTFLRRWEGGISGRGAASSTGSDVAGAAGNHDAKSTVRAAKVTTKVIARVTPSLTKSTITLLVRLMVTLDVTLEQR